jgi:DNA repair protein SbcC/Rad50
VIPVKLQLENFMSYGKGVAPLPLADIRLACLSGDNGNGKSALLDAMTWALFGETRAPREDDVIRLGTTGCRVLFDFRVGPTDYRVQKQRDKKGGSVWTLQAYQEDGTLRNISDGRETKAKVEQLLRMDYKTFLSTAYLKQGESDVFAKATPAERKRVLGEILDLSRYEELEKRARDKNREARERKAQSEQLLIAIDEELLDKDSFEQQKADAERLLVNAASALDLLQAERDAAQSAHANIEQFAVKASEWEEKRRELEREIDEKDKELARVQQQILKAEQLAATKPALRIAQKERDALSARIENFEAELSQSGSLYQEREALQKIVNAAQTELDRDLYRLDGDLTQLDQEAREIERYDAELLTSNAELAAYGDPEARRVAAESERQKSEDAMAELKARHGAAKSEQDRLMRRRDALEASAASRCEYCGQALSPEARENALAQTDRELGAVDEKLLVLSQQAREVQRQSKGAKEAVEQAIGESQAVAALINRRANAEQERLRLDQRLAERPRFEARRLRLFEALQQKQFAKSEQERLLVLAAQLEKTERIREELQVLRKTEVSYTNLPREWERLEQAELILSTEPERASALSEQLSERTEKLAKAEPKILEMRAKAADLPALRQRLDDAEYALRRQNEELRQAHARLGQLDGLLARLRQREAEREKIESERKAAAHDELIYQELSAAFGKKGVQALIIESTLPEIEAETNRLLDRMTAGALKVTFETQREATTKGVGTIETLDIRIADDLGERPLAMFSGGEAFRVNLALRVAMSKMLARRAGAPLQTLILDEGFGTQDPRGREAIADALEAISEEFSLILVITHIDELKDRFPTRIDIVKGPAGSSFTIG